MPFIHISASKKISEDDKNKIIKDVGKAIPILKGKSERWLMVKVSDDQNMCFEGKIGEDCAIVEVSVYGTCSSGEYAELTKALTLAVSECTEIAGDRIYVKYMETPYWGLEGSNF